MTRAERYAQVKALRDQGLLLREIRDRTGLALQTISDLLCDPTGEKAKERKARYQSPCIDCGKLTNPSGKRPRSGRCVKCNGAYSREMSRRWVLDSIREWADLHGGIPPVASDWNLAHARASGQMWRVKRTMATGRPWPSLALVQDHFGSWSNGLRVAGFEAFGPGKYGRDGEDEAVCAEYARRYLAGESMLQIADSEGVGYSTVQYRLEKAGVKRRSLVEAARLRREREKVAA